jgi:hypothetical protein
MPPISSDATYTLIKMGLAFVFAAVITGLLIFGFLRFTGQSIMPRHPRVPDVESVQYVPSAAATAPANY